MSLAAVSAAAELHNGQLTHIGGLPLQHLQQSKLAARLLQECMNMTPTRHPPLTAGPRMPVYACDDDAVRRDLLVAQLWWWQKPGCLDASGSVTDWTKPHGRRRRCTAHLLLCNCRCSAPVPGRT